jgi:hypothetical protein
MSIRTLLATAALAALICAPAHAALEQSGDTLEVDLQQATLPSYVGGRFTVRRCENCEPVNLTVTDATTFQVGANGERLTLAKFREAVFARGTSDVLLYVSYEFDSQAVTSIVMSTASAGSDAAAAR